MLFFVFFVFPSTFFMMQAEGGDEPLAVDYFTFSSSIADHLRAASLVISHAGIILIASSYPSAFFTIWLIKDLQVF